MSKKLTAFCLACGLVVLTPALAAVPDLQATATGISGQTVTVSVHNPTSGAVSARVRVVVQLGDESFYLLSSGNFTVAAGVTTSIAITAPQPVVEIEDDPEPF